MLKYHFRFIIKSERISFRKLIVNNMQLAILLVSYVLSIFSNNIFPTFNQIKNPFKNLSNVFIEENYWRAFEAE